MVGSLALFWKQMAYGSSVRGGCRQSPHHHSLDGARGVEIYDKKRQPVVVRELPVGGVERAGPDRDRASPGPGLGRAHIGDDGIVEAARRQREDDGFTLELT